MRNKFASVSDPNIFVTCPGDKYHVSYEPLVWDDGTVTLVEAGKDDIQAMIDSYRDQTDMSFILRQLSMGNDSVLNQRVGTYGDFTNMPKTYAEALQMVMSAESKFNKLAPELKNKFDNDYRKWFATAGTDDWFTKMGIDVSIPEPVSEVKDNES